MVDTSKFDDLGFLLKPENVAWYEDGKVRILDRRIYPVRTEFVVCERHEDVAQAIADMVTQSGGPYTAAAMGMALAAYEVKDAPEAEVREHLTKAAYTLSHARPTTTAKMQVVTARCLEAAEKALDEGVHGEALTEVLAQKAFDLLDGMYTQCESASAHLAKHVPQGGTVMTQCFAEAYVGMIIRHCRRLGNEIKMICPETRPYFQGARLTASVASEMGLDVTLITDNMPAYVLSQGMVDLFTSAADVITMDGYVVNKVGTLQIAISANRYGVPYFCTGTPNKGHPTIDTVKIEQRDPELVTMAMDLKVTHPEVKGYYPAFDITPPELVGAIVTDRGLYSPYDLESYPGPLTGVGL